MQTLRKVHEQLWPSTAKQCCSFGWPQGAVCTDVGSVTGWQGMSCQGRDLILRMWPPNHRRDWKGPPEVIHSPAVLKKFYLKLVPNTTFRRFFSISRQRLHLLSGQPVSVNQKEIKGSKRAYFPQTETTKESAQKLSPTTSVFLLRLCWVF